MPDEEHRSITVQEIRLTDSEGKLRGWLSTEANGWTSLALCDVSGKKRVEVAVPQDGNPYVHLNDSRGCPRLDLYVDQNGDPGVGFFSEGSELLLSIGLSEKRKGVGITMWSGGEGKHHFSIEVDPDGHHQSGF